MCRGDEELKLLIITVAGMSKRFSRSVGYDCLKCIYYEDNPKDTLLYRIIKQNQDVDKYIIVGGFQFGKLEEYVKDNLQDLQDKIILVYNNYYEKYGSGYSLYLGIRESLKWNFDELIFTEGDLYIDRDTFSDVFLSADNVITINNEPIYANKAVVLYLDQNRIIHYLYDTAHNSLTIQEPFIAIFNSGQIWKFVSRERVYEVFQMMVEDEWKETNLEFIQRYFKNLSSDEYEIINCPKWINCNTIEDYKKIKGCAE